MRKTMKRNVVAFSLSLLLLLGCFRGFQLLCLHNPMLHSCDVYLEESWYMTTWKASATDPRNKRLGFTEEQAPWIDLKHDHTFSAHNFPLFNVDIFTNDWSSTGGTWSFHPEHHPRWASIELHFRVGNEVTSAELLWLPKMGENLVGHTPHDVEWVYYGKNP